MRNGTQHVRSIAAELALLSLSELEPRIAEDPELLVSTETVLCLATIRHSDPAQWQRWRAILEKYNKAALIEHMLREPERVGDSDWKSKADTLIGLAMDAGLEPFHDPDQQGWASVHVGGHWENHPIRSREFQLFLLQTYYRHTDETPGLRPYVLRRTCSRHGRCLMESNAGCTCALPSTAASSTLIYAIDPGGR